MNPFITAAQAKVLSYVTEDWIAQVDIAQWVGYKEVSYCSRILKILKEKGLVEEMWDENIGRRYWRLKQ
ncbi:hypothetical protein CCP3SC15_420003 [Gammaproteobacteria bacterium]